MNSKSSWVWQPPRETIEAIATVLREHWAAAKSQPLQSLFWQRTVSWRSQLTSAPAAADSSDTLPDPHPC